jgi:hypothetical protein
MPNRFAFKERIAQCAYSRTGGETTVDQPDMRGLVTARNKFVVELPPSTVEDHPVARRLLGWSRVLLPLPILL